MQSINKQCWSIHYAFSMIFSCLNSNMNQIVTICVGVCADILLACRVTLILYFLLQCRLYKINDKEIYNYFYNYYYLKI